MKETNIIRKGRRLAYLLRHDNEALEMGKIDSNGWRNVAEIIECGFSRPLLEEIVATNDKKRYEFNADFTKIRAKQGHSIPVDVELAIATPPEYLYHGTCEDTKEIILRKGIKGMRRLYVHLSKDYDTALKVGKRKGDNVLVFKVLSSRMCADGVTFHKSRNGVWLTNYVAPEYIEMSEGSISERHIHPFLFFWHFAEELCHSACRKRFWIDVNTTARNAKKTSRA